MSGLTRETLQAVLMRAAHRLERCVGELNDLDAKIGDGDMGSTLASISRALRGEGENLPEDLGDCFSRVVRVIGGTSGSSLSAVAMMGFHRMAVETKGQTTISWSELGGLLKSAVSAMQERSGANPGDKSIIDGLMFVADAISRESDPTIMAALANSAAHRALDEFRGRPSKIGRARLAPQKGVGQDDPGMVALKVIIEAIRDRDDTVGIGFAEQAKTGGASSKSLIT